MKLSLLHECTSTGCIAAPPGGYYTTKKKKKDGAQKKLVGESAYLPREVGTNITDNPTKSAFSRAKKGGASKSAASFATSGVVGHEALPPDWKGKKG